VLTHMTSYYSRSYDSPSGEQSSQWLYNHLLQIIAQAPFGTRISLEAITHPWMQFSIIARFEPPVRNASLPITIIGAHQDSINNWFPLLPAPGADDDCSGTVSILEAFRVLALKGFSPDSGPVEFHWYSAEEGGGLGSNAVAVDYKTKGLKVGAMIQFDMTAFIPNSQNESIVIVTNESDEPLLNWTANLSREYVSIPTVVASMKDGGSDYMIWSRAGFPATMATESDASEDMKWGFNPHVHTARDRMDVDDQYGIFSIDHMARFAELAIAFAVEQGGWKTGRRMTSPPGDT